MAGTKPEGNEAGGVARLISYCVVLGVSAFLFIDARGLPTSRWEVLGAGAFPQLVFGLLCVLSALAIVGALRKLSMTGAAGFAAAAAHWLRSRHLVLVMAICFSAYLLAIPQFGFSIATFAFLMVAQLALAPRTWKSLLLALGIATVFSFGLNALFAELFNVFLPRGA
ncbi:tripartite tricarboxylate transporter TctB family protein [Algihabitans albus]|uniref:tripartite tricarboxylate transporter TctB family protein n=1 Tax=Algihabitans albus TaxID=2164067 RepID=UPI000E5D0032|nr:tripartite tricarboxylate transporter TctB family protein [Algihabitans albus]